MISTFSFLRRSSKSSSPIEPCICKNATKLDLSTNGAPLEPVTSNDSNVSYSSTHTDTLYEPPCPNGGSEFPILLPNEVLLQKFSNRKSALRVSNWKLQQQKLKCRRCSMAGCEVNVNDTTNSTGCTSYTENSHEELTDSTVQGVVYVTSERIIFVPKSETVKGYTLDITLLSSMKAIESTKRVWFFVCYKNNNSIATIPFSTQNRCQAFLRLIKNIRFEHMVRKCLPPRYTPGDYTFEDVDIASDAESTISTNSDSSSSTDSTDTSSPPDDWWYGDNQLPSYSESEEALHKYLHTIGLLTETEPLDRTERISRLIALATVPQSVSLESTTSSTNSHTHSHSSTTPRSTTTATTIPDAYHSPYVWF